MELDAKGRVAELAGLLTVVSLALIFAAALGVVPPSLLPRTSDAVLKTIPHANAIISTTAIATILGGWYAARQRAFRRHRALMLTSLALFAAFLLLYLYKVAIAGPAAFPGPDDVYRTVYLPLLAIHIILAMVCIPLLYFVVLLGLTREVSELFDTRHAKVGRVAASLWLISFVLGNAVYALLYVVYG